jgi:hypothetical protein
MHIILGLVIAFIVVAIVARRNHGTRQCRWRADRSGNRGALCRYRCAFCGAATFTSDGKPPKVCHRDRTDVS